MSEHTPPRSPYRGHVFVCTADFAGGCGPKGGPAIAKALRRELRDRGIRSAFAVTTTGCVGGCKRGANVVVHPDGTWYGGMSPEDVPRLVDEHLIRGRALIDRLREDRHPPEAAPELAGDLPRIGEGGWPRLVRDAAGRDVLLSAVPRHIRCDDAGAREIVEVLAGELCAVDGGGAVRIFRGAPPPDAIPSIALSDRITLYGIQGDIGLLGRVLGVEERAAALNRSLEERLSRVRAHLPPPEERPRVLFLTADGWSCGNWGAAGTAIYFAGGRNLAAGLGLEGLTPLAAAARTLEPDVLVTAPPMDPEAPPSPLIDQLRTRPGLREIAIGEVPSSHRILDTIERLSAALHRP